ncbi:MAG: nicotinate phosphoribosyltransferase [Promethearchaeota archaeon]
MYKTRGLFTDLYQLTMSQGYHALGMENEVATFDLFFRKNPFKGGYAIAAGTKLALEYLRDVRFTEDDLDYLKSKQMFTAEFIEYLRNFSFSGRVEGVLEGTIVFPFSPIFKITAPIIEAQLVETALLNIINYSTLIATKAARICNAARGGSVVEFGLRRAQGDSAYLGTRAALIGGCSATSFVSGGKMWGAPIVGTHAHSWVQMFDSELESFRAYAKIFPDDCILLIDTYNTLKSGVPNAIQVAKELKEAGHNLVGIRIDSGDLGYLAFEAWKRFQDAGLNGVKIILSNDLDEHVIENIVQEIMTGGNGEAGGKGLVRRKEFLKDVMYGVGTKLITGGTQSALGGVYKLVALDGKPKIKISENVLKTVNPGIKKIWRVAGADGYLVADVLALENERPPIAGDIVHHTMDPYKTYILEDGVTIKPLHQTLMSGGKIAGETKNETWQDAQRRCKDDYNTVHPTNRRLLNPHSFKVSLTEALFDLKGKMIKKYSTT